MKREWCYLREELTCSGPYKAEEIQKTHSQDKFQGCTVESELSDSEWEILVTKESNMSKKSIVTIPNEKPSILCEHQVFENPKKVTKKDKILAKSAYKRGSWQILVHEFIELGDMCRVSGCYQLGKECYESAYSLCRKHLGMDNLSTLECLGYIARAYDDLGN